MKKTKKVVPASASLFRADLEFSQKKTTDKTAKVKLLARTGDPINHPYWGAIVHDLSGMRLHKNRLSIDYNHNGDEIIGYLNKFETDSGDLVTSGALTPFSEQDRASEIIFKMNEGVPYEASINFSDDMVIQEYDEGEMTEVNGRQLTGPLTVVREWGLRNVAVCALGADKNTEANLFNESGKEFTVTVISNERETEMKKPKTVDAEATELAVTEAVEVEVDEVVDAVEESTEEEAVEATEETTELSVDAGEASESEEVEAVEEATELSTEEATELSEEISVEESEESTEEATELSAERKEFKAMVEEFGAEKASEYFTSNTSLSVAREMHYEALKVENTELRSQLEALTSNVEADADVAFDCTDDVDPVFNERVQQFRAKGLSLAKAKYAASIRV